MRNRTKSAAKMSALRYKIDRLFVFYEDILPADPLSVGILFRIGRFVRRRFGNHNGVAGSPRDVCEADTRRKNVSDHFPIGIVSFRGQRENAVGQMMRHIIVVFLTFRRNFFPRYSAVMGGCPFVRTNPVFQSFGAGRPIVAGFIELPVVVTGTKIHRHQGCGKQRIAGNGIHIGIDLPDDGAVKVNLRPEIRLLNEGERQGAPAESPADGIGRRHSGREVPEGIMIIVQSDTGLPEIIGATHPPGGFPGRLNSRKQQGDEHTDNCNNDEKFNESERIRFTGHKGLDFLCQPLRLRSASQRTRCTFPSSIARRNVKGAIGRSSDFRPQDSRIKHSWVKRLPSRPGRSMAYRIDVFKPITAARTVPDWAELY